MTAAVAMTAVTMTAAAAMTAAAGTPSPTLSGLRLQQQRASPLAACCCWCCPAFPCAHWSQGCWWSQSSDLRPVLKPWRLKCPVLLQLWRPSLLRPRALGRTSAFLLSGALLALPACYLSCPRPCSYRSPVDLGISWNTCSELAWRDHRMQLRRRSRSHLSHCFSAPHSW